MLQEEFAAFYAGVRRGFRLYLLQLCGNESLADELFQESFCRFLQRVPNRLNEAQRRAYLYRIGSRLEIDRRRRLRLEKDLLLSEREAPTVSASDRLGLDMAKVFQRLKPRERSLLWLAHVEGFSHVEIAAVLGVGERSVRVLLDRARKKLAGLMERRGYAKSG